MGLDTATMKTLEGHQARGDRGRAPYYRILQAAKDPYGTLALGVVLQDQMAGRAAYSYAMEVAKRYRHPINSQGWVTLSVALMRAHYQARLTASNFEPGGPSLQWHVIRDYHKLAFQTVAGLPPVAWTAWIPLIIEGQAGDAQLWRRMLTQDFLRVAVETAWLVLGRAAQEAGVSKALAQSVIPILSSAPPVVTGVIPAVVGFSACMEALRSLPGNRTPNETMAIFYLDCLASAVNVERNPLAPFEGVYGPSAGPTVGDVERWVGRDTPREGR